jgi:hypothetical protein
VRNYSQLAQKFVRGDSAVSFKTGKTVKNRPKTVLKPLINRGKRCGQLRTISGAQLIVDRTKLGEFRFIVVGFGYPAVRRFGDLAIKASGIWGLGRWRVQNSKCLRVEKSKSLRDGEVVGFETARSNKRCLPTPGR